MPRKKETQHTWVWMYYLIIATRADNNRWQVDIIDTDGVQTRLEDTYRKSSDARRAGEVYIELYLEDVV